MNDPKTTLTATASPADPPVYLDALSALAGDALNKRIARLMGWDGKHQIEGCEDCWYNICIFCGKQDHCGGLPEPCESAPHYSTSIEWAVQVAVKFGLTLAPYGKGEEIEKWHAADGVVIAFGETLPLAACRAALLAYERREANDV